MRRSLALCSHGDKQARRETQLQAIESALSDLTFWLRYLDTWSAKAQRLATDAVDGVRDGASVRQWPLQNWHSIRCAPNSNIAKKLNQHWTPR